MNSPHLGTLDIVILLCYVVTLAGIGWWAARKTSKDNTDDYFLASRSIPWLITTCSFLATVISALTFVATPGEGYSADCKYLFSNIGDMAACFFVAGFFLPAFQKARVTSIYELVQNRFGQSVRTACSAYFLITRTLASTVRIVAIAKVVEVVTGNGLSFTTCVVGTVVVILSYTVMGGGRAVAWTDTMQFFLLVGGALMALGYIIHLVPGGVMGIIDAGTHAVDASGHVHNKFNFMEAFSGPNLTWVILLSVWAFFQSTAAYGCDQDMAQRLLACNDNRKARWSLMLSGLAGIPINCLFLFIGVGLYAYSRVHPEFVAGMADPDHVFPRFILTVLPEGLRGLLLAAVASAAMGSADSALASLATAFVLDFYKPYFGAGGSERRMVIVSKLSYVGFGIIFVALAITIRSFDQLLWLSFKIVPYTYGPLLGVFLVGIMTDWKVRPGRMLALMFGTTLFFASLAITAYVLHDPLTPGSIWSLLHKDYWRLYVVFAALTVPFGSFFLRDR